MNKINEVFEEYYSGMTDIERKYFKTHGRYFKTDIVIAFGGFKEALHYTDFENKKLRDAIIELEKQLDKTRRDTPWGVARYDMDAIIKEALKEEK